jgi:hypothetical protein
MAQSTTSFGSLDSAFESMTLNSPSTLFSALVCPEITNVYV